METNATGPRNGTEMDSEPAVETYRELVRDTTINETTLLSTDYLNHFNELVMLLEITADMPEMLEDVAAWEPKSYQEHFRDSTFQHKDLAVEAFDAAPAEFRVPLEQTVDDINQTIAEGLPTITDAAERHAMDGDAERFQHECLTFLESVRIKVEHASAIINGAVRAEAEQADAVSEEVMDQSSIDALFD